MQNFNPQPKTKKKTSRKSLVKKLDTIVSLYIRKRDKRCVVCGSTENLTNGHVFSRSNYSARWDITKDGNCHCQCMSCNLRHEYDPYPYTNWYVKTFKQKKYDDLHFRWNQTSKMKDFELEELYQKINNKYLTLN